MPTTNYILLKNTRTAIEQRHTIPEEWLEGLLQNTNCEVLYLCGKQILEDETLSRDERIKKATPYFQKAAERDHSQAQFELAQLLDKYFDAYEIYLKLAQQGHVDAMFMLGKCFENGLGTNEDLEEAFMWYNEAAQKGHLSSQFKVALMTLHGNGTAQDTAKFHKLIQPLVKQNHGNAQFWLGTRYFFGDGVKQNYAQAERYIRVSVTNGCDIEHCQTYLNIMHTQMELFLQQDNLSLEIRLEKRKVLSHFERLMDIFEREVQKLNY